MEKMDNQMSLKNNAFATRQNYIRGIRTLMLHHKKLPEECTADEIRAYLVYERDKKIIKALFNE